MDHQSNKRKASCQRHFEFSNDIFERYRRIRRKIDNLRAKRRLKEKSESRSIPKINNKSRKILKSPKKFPIFNPSRLQNTQNIIKNSRFMPKSVKISLVSLMSPTQRSSVSTERHSSHNVSIFSPRSDSPQFYASLVKPSSKIGSLDNSEYVSYDIESRNKLLFSLREKTSSMGFNADHEEPPDGQTIHERSKRWLIRKKCRLENERKSKEDAMLMKCTFKPKLVTKRNFSTVKTSRTQTSEGSYTDIHSRNRSARAFLSSKSSTITNLIKPNHSLASSPRAFLNEKPYFTMTPYEKLTPIKMSIGYKHGFTNRLKVKSQPMLSYSKFHLKTS
ncbi:hypothetical protein SteCoe_24108 [Stentor coeruleus]|uniref:Uncharacterized protein n=1 Tax=Stentor coeruleus TaxID=5963 RepID=A0A1R2BID0_9CILI|nr:hypothetical protein SteCoe_24108 [Stentor coeruleus]